MLKPHHILLLILFSSCSFIKNDDEKSKSIDEGKLKIKESNSLYFRYSYNINEDSFSSNFNPSLEESIIEKKDSNFIETLREMNLIEEGQLILNLIDTLPNSFLFTYKENMTLETKINQLRSLNNFEIIFTNQNIEVTRDTLEFEFPPDVTFFKFENKNKKDELFSLFHYYISNGESYELKRYSVSN